MAPATKVKLTGASFHDKKRERGNIRADAYVGLIDVSRRSHRIFLFPFHPRPHASFLSFSLSFFSMMPARLKKIFSPSLPPLLFPQLILGDVVAVGGGGKGGESG